MSTYSVIYYTNPYQRAQAKAAAVNITVRQSRQSGVARATCPD